MQTLPFIVSKPSTATGPIETEAIKGAPIAGPPFTQVLSQQMAQEDAKKALTKANSQLAKTTAQKKNIDNTTIDDVTSGGRLNKSKPNANRPDEHNIDVQKIDAQSPKAQSPNAQSLDAQSLDAQSPNAQNIDAGWLASVLTAKNVQEATDGKVVLDDSQTDTPVTADSSMAIANLQPAVIAPAVGPLLAPVTPATIAKEGSASIAMSALHDEQVQAHRDANLAIKASINDAPIQQKITDFNGRQQQEQDDLLQVAMAETKVNNASDLTMQKAMPGITEASIMTAASLQPATKFGAPAVTTANDNRIHVFPGKTGWNEAVSQQVVWMVGATEQSATLMLNPPELGPLEVIIQVNNEKADATFISENPVVRKALEDGISTLRQLMGEAGVALGQANVNTSQQQSSKQSHRAHISPQPHNDAGLHIETDGRNQERPVRQTNGLVDIFA
jgi:flagellar hook-length control protein FliK